MDNVIIEKKPIIIEDGIKVIYYHKSIEILELGPFRSEYEDYLNSNIKIKELGPFRSEYEDYSDSYIKIKEVGPFKNYVND